MEKQKCLCNECERHCCSNRFTGLAGALKRNAQDEFVQIMLDKKEVKKLKKYGYDNFIEKIGDDFYLALNPDFSCKAFKDGLCSIYEARPDVCRLYPYYFDPFCGIAIDRNCPGNFDLEDADKKEIYDILKRRMELFKKKGE